MKIGGFLKNSLIDYPGTIACVVFTQGCNFKCPYCHNPELVPMKQPSDTASVPDQNADILMEKEVFEFLERRKKLLDGVVISGGEPTLQKDLLSFCQKVKQMGFKLKLDTNGSRPDILSKLFKESLVDFVAMDIKTRPDMYSLVHSTPYSLFGDSTTSKILKSIHCIMDNAPAYEFRTTCVKPFITPELLGHIGYLIRGASAYVLQNCSQKAKVLDPAFMTKTDNFYSDAEMEQLKDIIGPYVAFATVR